MYNTRLYNKNIIVNDLPIKSGDRVLDLGSGRQGYFTFTAAKLAGDKGKVWAVDKDNLAVDNIDSLAKLYNYYNVKAVKGNIETLDQLYFDDESVDVILLTNVLSELRKQNELLANIYRILRKKGHLFIVDWARNDFPNAPRNLLNKDLLKDHIRDNYYTVLKELVPGDKHYGLVAMKH